MWFKMSMDILSCGFIRDIKLSYHKGDSAKYNRIVACISLLSITASGFGNDIQDSADLAMLVDTTPKQAQIVWDVCIKHGVLRKGEHGYSARPWMIERGILADMRKRKGTEDGGRGQQQQQQQMRGKLVF